MSAVRTRRAHPCTPAYKQGAKQLQISRATMLPTTTRRRAFTALASIWAAKWRYGNATHPKLRGSSAPRLLLCLLQCCAIFVAIAKLLKMFVVASPLYLKLIKIFKHRYITNCLKRRRGNYHVAAELQALCRTLLPLQLFDGCWKIFRLCCGVQRCALVQRGQKRLTLGILMAL